MGTNAHGVLWRERSVFGRCGFATLAYTGGIKMESDEVTKILRKCELFSELSDKELRYFAKLGSVQEYEAASLRNYMFCPKDKFLSVEGLI